MSLEEVRTYINQIRREFADKPLDEAHLNADPYEQFAIWMEEAVNCQILDPYAMCVSTVADNGSPSSRIVYLRDVIAGGMIFYTNYQSRKGSEIGSTGKVALNFHWNELERQIRIVGTAEKANAETSDRYWAARPRESQISACLSEQSQEVASRDELEKRKAAIIAEFEGKEIPRPKHWGGYSVKPVEFEFWQGRPNRLHDRFVYLKQGGGWRNARLNP